MCDEVTQDYQCNFEKLMLCIIFIYVKDLIYVKITVVYEIELVNAIRFLKRNKKWK